MEGQVPGTDTILGGPGNDLIIHGNNIDAATATDGHKDFINCGPGSDVAYLNTSIDGDKAINCEHVNAG